jgi:C-terminal processing protease CtpA/Prc
MLEQDIVCGHKHAVIGRPEVDGDRVTIRAEVSGDDFKIIGIDNITATYEITVSEDKIDSISVKMDSEDWEEVEEKTSGGLGINIEFVKQGIRIKGFAEKSPAKEAGMQSGDIICGIEGISCDTMDNWEIVYRLRGPVGSKVNLTVIREGVDELIDIVVTRIKLD